MLVKIKRIDKSLPLSRYETKGAVGFDLVCREGAIVGEGEIARIPANMIVKMPLGYMLMITARSSTASKRGLLITTGIIDQDYCGEDDEILIQVYNFTSADVKIEKGDRIAQGIFVKVEQGEWQEVEKMADNSRGGFGTTG